MFTKSAVVLGDFVPPVAENDERGHLQSFPSRGDGGVRVVMSSLTTTVASNMSIFACFSRPVFDRNDAPPDRLMSPAVKGSRIVASPMRPRTAGAESAVGDATPAAVRQNLLGSHIMQESK